MPTGTNIQIHVGKRRLVDAIPIAHDGNVSLVEPGSYHAELDSPAGAVAPGPVESKVYVRALAPATNVTLTVSADADLGPAVQEVVNTLVFDFVPETADHLFLDVGPEEDDPDAASEAPAQEQPAKAEEDNPGAVTFEGNSFAGGQTVEAAPAAA